MQRESIILKGFHPDPSVIRVGQTFYLANSTFEWFPGVEIHESTDLIHWKLTGHVLTDAEQLPMEGVLNSGGVWAPCLSYDGQYFYVIFSIVRTFDEMTQDNNNYITRATDIHGPWSKPIYLNSGGFDASLFHDEDGKKYLINMIWEETINKNHFHGIEMQEYDAENGKLIGPRKNIYKGTERGLTEGPHIYQKDGWYYLLTAEGGTSEQHCVTMARSRNVWGPYETDESGPMLTSYGHPDLSIQYAGHGDLVDDIYGNWYLFHLGARKSLFQNYSVFGRETFAQNVDWSGDWPKLIHGNTPSEMIEIPDEFVKEEIGSIEKTAKEPKTILYDFSEGIISPDFMTLRRPLSDIDCNFKERQGYLRLRGRESLSSKFCQTLLARRVTDASFCVETSLDFYPDDIRQRAGLTIYYHSANYYYLYIGYDDEKNVRFLQLVKRQNKKTYLMMNKEIILPKTGEIQLGIEFSPEGLQFYYIVSDTKTYLCVPKEECPVWILSDEYANVSMEQGFTGTFMGICVQDLTGRGKEADFRYFKVENL